jgi:uncharacterized protein YqcC (DUF446 family)
MRIVLILFAMIFMHIVDDYYLQGVLAKMKQRSWWEENAPQEEYKHDYKVALIMHAFSWSFMIMLPYILFVVNEATFCVAITINTAIHAFVDDLKANRKAINLVADQTVHIIQVILTWAFVGLLGF